jgi:hypothetical protein
MRALSRTHSQPESRDFRRNPVTCVALTIVLAATFWAGLIWVAERLYG